MLCMEAIQGAESCHWGRGSALVAAGDQVYSLTVHARTACVAWLADPA